MKTVRPKELPAGEFHSLLLASVAPRPICFASTIDADGNPNLSPFSFFNVFGSNPPVMIFSPARRVRDNTIKHTLENVQATGEVSINVVNYEMVQQVSLASTEYPKGVNEFVKSGLTPIKSELIKPFRVKESPVQFECKVIQVIETGKEGGSGNLIVCEMLLMHINEKVLDDLGRIDQNKIDLVARLGADWYVRASGNALFEVEKPIRNMGIGVDRIPEHIRLSKILTGNNLGQLGNSETLPDKEQVEIFMKLNPDLANVIKNHSSNKETLRTELHILAKKYLEEGKVSDAWKILLV